MRTIREVVSFSMSGLWIGVTLGMIFGHSTTTPITSFGVMGYANLSLLWLILARVLWITGVEEDKDE